ncbi:MAG TPA: succinate--CoA ligase subunit beta [Nostocaceae cyanobacterium]|nr:succinate--CoA ligase subunit beta [Nostocaceae cyanobacterium]
MDLLEYQVKEWFGKMGIPVLPSQRIEHPTDLKRLKIRYPIVLKSQVHGGERAKAGGVRIVETTIDAIAAAQNIFNLPIWGELPEVLLAESKYDAQEECYLAVVLDTAICRPVLLGGKEANIDWDSAGDKMQYVVVEQEFSPFYARRLALKMGLQGTLMQSVSDVIEKMYQLFVQKDLDLVEINPLAVSTNGQLMALNGKVRVNERAIKRHPDIAQIAAKLASSQHRQENKRSLGDWQSLEMPGKIGILGNGTGSVLTTLDAVVNAGGKPGLCLNLRHAFLTDTTPTSFSDRLQIGLQMLASDKSMSVILINFLGTIPQFEQIPEVINEFIHSTKSLNNNGNKNKQGQLPRLVIRLAGSEFDSTRSYLTSLDIPNEGLIIVENLDTAATTAVRLAKLPIYRK